MGGKSQPDFGDVAASQGEENRQVIQDQLFANRPDQYTPWGYSSWEQTPYTDAEGNQTMRWSQTQGLTPELQDILNKQVAIQGGRSDIAGMLTGRMGAEFGNQMDWTGLNPMGQRPTAQYTLPEEVNRNLDYGGIPGIDDPYQTRQAAEDAVYSQAQSRIAPQQQSERAALETKMRNQGLGPQDAAWQSQMQGLGQRHTDQTNQALWSANQAGRDESDSMFGQQMGRRQQYGSERERQAAYFNQAGQQAFNQALSANQQNFGQSMQGSNYANQIRQQQMTEAMQKRGFSLNEINALLSGQQVGMPQMPNFSQAGAAQPAPYMQGAAQQASMDAASNPWGALLGAGATLGGGYLAGMSDRRLKSNIRKVGTVNGHNWYKYDFLGTPAQGVMADELPADYVTDMGGYQMVNYSKVLG
jgi:hypothetical protein